MSLLLTTAEILATHDVIDPVFLESPSMRHLALDDALGCAVTLTQVGYRTIRISGHLRGFDDCDSAIAAS